MELVEKLDISGCPDIVKKDWKPYKIVPESRRTTLSKLPMLYEKRSYNYEKYEK
jgi:hypothetical protein